MAINGTPLLPSTPKTPNQTVTVNNTADKKIKAAMRKIQNGVIQLMNDIPKNRVAADQAGIVFNAASYEYLLTPAAVNALPDQIGEMIREYLMENSAFSWYMYDAIQAASDTGASAEITNLQAQTSVAEYPVTVQSAILAAPHQARVELAKGRVFEEMQNLTETMKVNLSRVLGEGMEAGLGPRVIAEQIYQEIGLPEWNAGNDKASYARALRISRTEINNAHRRAKVGERKQARKIGLNVGVMHLSALRETTRQKHAARHGWVGTDQEETLWYSQGANSINCFCSTIAIVLDSEGKVRSQGFMNKVEMQKAKYILQAD